MLGDQVPVTDHVVRWCKPSHVDPETGEIGIGAFLLTEKDTDGGISVNWLEHCDPSDAALQLQLVRSVLAQKINPVRKSSRLAKLNVGNSINAVEESSSSLVHLTVIHSPDVEPGKWDDQSHSLLMGLKQSDEDSAVALRDSVLETFPAS